MSSKKNIKYDDEINLVEIFLTIWNHKPKIFLITAVAVILMFGFQTIQKRPTIILFQANTEIKSISTFDEFEYETYNYYLEKIRSKKITASKAYTQGPVVQKSLNLKTINKDYLFKLFIDKINDNQLSTEAIKKFSLIEPSDYNSSFEYENAVMKLASSIKVLNYKNHGKKIKSNELPYWNLEFNTDNKNKWENALKFIESKANKQIQKYLYETFNTLILNLEKLKKYEIEDIEVEISEAFRNYEATISNRLVFLKEQAQIARSLNLPKNTPENRIISTAGVTKEDNFSNYYMRGYEMIEKEIDLIQNRTDKKPFIENLIDLEKEKNRLLKDKDIDRIQTLFENTPIAKSDNFFAAKIENKSTQYKQLNFETSIMMRMLISAGLFGLIFGMIYVLIANAAKKRK